MSKQKGMSVTGALVLLMMGGLAALTIKEAYSNTPEEGVPYASVACRVKDGLGGSIAGIGIETGSVIDAGCAAREAGRLAPDEARQELMWCSQPEAISTFGSVRNCLDYNGDNEAIIQRVEQLATYCEHKSKKWYRRVTFQRNRSYDRCMTRYRGNT
jgi:hypothetical protein